MLVEIRMFFEVWKWHGVIISMNYFSVKATKLIISPCIRCWHLLLFTPTLHLYMFYFSGIGGSVVLLCLKYQVSLQYIQGCGFLQLGSLLLLCRVVGGFLLLSL